jgi:pyruvate,water dikinase
MVDPSRPTTGCPKEAPRHMEDRSRGRGESLQPGEESLQPGEESLQRREESLQPSEESLQPREEHLQPPPLGALRILEGLSGDTKDDLSRLGGKGCGLVRLMRAGFPVPEVHCLPADIETPSDALRGDLEALVSAHPGASFAVRSSAMAEDLHDASFAGVYTTLLGVRGVTELEQAIDLCRASLQSEAARAYRVARGLGDDVRMAVLVQRLVEPDVAGVLLTANPQRAFANEIVIDAAFGLGEGVVSGRVDPDHVVLDRASGSLREQRVGEKRIALGRGPGFELIEQPVDVARRAALCLDASELAELHALARAVGDRLGPRMDVEWAIEHGRLHLLQARPITGLPAEEPEDVWSRRFGDEYMADYTTPAGYTFLVRWIREYTFTDTARRLGRHDLLEMEPLRRHKGYVYMSGRYAGANARALPASGRADALRGWYPPSFTRRIEAEPFSPWLLVKTLLLPYRDSRGPMKKNVVALAAHADLIMREIAPRLHGDYGAEADDALARAVAEVDELGYDHFRVIRWGMGQYAPMLHDALRSVLSSWAEDESGALYQALASGLPGTHTAQINRDVWRLGMAAREDAAVAAGLRAGQDVDALRAQTPESALWALFDAFLDAHGHRSTTRDIAQPRWREAPALIIALVRAQLVGDEAPPDPAELEAGAQVRREQARVEAFARLGRGPIAALRRRLLGWLIERTGVFTVYRENQRYYLDVLLSHLRNLVLEQGRRMVAGGVLSDPWQGFLLEADELRALFAGEPAPAGLSEELAERQRHFDTWNGRLPATFLYDDVETEGEVVEGDPPAGGAETTEAAGLGASRGIARGRLRVITQVTDLDQIERGDILVAENIDPGWTSVFPLLAGLITETGGLLSHGALLAREYGIPAVMGVQDARRHFESGEHVEIDGARGTIEPI